MNIGSLLSALPGSVAQGLIYGILALGVYITFKVLDYADLTVDGSLATGGAVAAVAMVAGLSPWLALVLAVIAGMLTGAITGFLHTTFGIPAVLSGILTQLALYSINIRILGNKSNVSVGVDKYPLLVSLRYVAKSILLGAVFVAVVIAFLYWLFGTEVGSAVRATGTNPNMSRAQGINTNRMKLLGLMISNGLVGLAGALYAQYQGNADVNMGRGAIVIGLASVIIGEVLGEAIFGKYFNFAVRLACVVAGAIIYYIVIAVVLWLGLSTQDLKLFSALFVAVALAVPYLQSRRRPKKKAAAKVGKGA